MTQFVYDKIKSGTTDPIIMDSNAVGAPQVIATMDIGGIKKGDTFDNVQDLLQALITPYKAPTWSQSLNPGKVEKGIATSITARVDFTVQSNPVTEIKIDGTSFTIDPSATTGYKSKPVDITKNTGTKNISFSIKDSSNQEYTENLSVTIEGKFKIYFSTSSELTAQNIHDIDNDANCAVRTFFASNSIYRVTNTVANAYTYFIVPNKYNITDITDSMGTAVSHSLVNTLTVSQHDSTLTESYKVYRTTEPSSAGEIVYKINPK